MAAGAYEPVPGSGVSSRGRVTVAAGSLLLTTLMAACGGPASVTRFTVHTVAAPPDEVAGTARVIRERFDAWVPGGSSRVDTTIEGNRIDFDFHGATPTAAEIVYLGSTRGEYRLAARDSPDIAWVSDLDFLSAKCADGEFAGSEVVSLVAEVKPAAAERLATLTRQNLGKQVLSTWDDRVIGQATINTELGVHFEMMLMPDEHMRMRCTILQTGRLPAAVDSFSFEQKRIS